LDELIFMAVTETKLRRGSTAQVAAMTPADGEVVVDQTKKIICVGDGSTAGGNPHMRGSVTTGTIPKCSAAGVLADSVIIESSSKIGIGTTPSSAQFHVLGSFGGVPTNGSTNTLKLESSAASGVGVGPSIILTGQTGNTTTSYAFAGIQGVKESASAENYAGSLVFFCQASGGASALTEVMRITSAGAATITGALTTTGAATIGGTATLQGSLVVPATITAPGTTTTQTINKMSGRVNIAALGTSVTVNNSLVTANSIVIAVCATNDANAYVKNVVPGSGSFVITLGAAANAETAINFLVIK
jgi:hypothetical protein